MEEASKSLDFFAEKGSTMMPKLGILSGAPNKEHLGHSLLLLPRPWLHGSLSLIPNTPFILDGRIANRQTRTTLAIHSAIPRGTNYTTQTNANRTIRIAAQRTQGLRGPNSVVLGGDMTANER